MLCNPTLNALTTVTVAGSGLVPRIVVRSVPGAAVTVRRGATVLTAEEEDGAWVFDVPAFGAWTATAVKGGFSKSRVVDVTDVRQQEVNLRAEQYGYRVKKLEPDPEARVEYILDAVGKTPARMNYSTGKFDYGDWEDVWFVRGNYPCMLNYDGTEAYRLDPDNPARKEDGTASDAGSTSFGGNAMAAFPLCWVKRYEEGGYQYVIFSEMQVDETYKAYAHTDAAGNIKERFYLRMFEGCSDGTRVRSLHNSSISSGSSFASAMSMAAENGPGWSLRSRSVNQFVADLCTLISKSDNNQNAFGEGYSYRGSNSSGASWSSGGRFCGGQSSSSPVRMFFCENLYGNKWEFEVGTINDHGAVLAKMTPEGGGYNTTGEGYITVPGLTAVSMSVEYLSETVQTEYGRIPSGVQRGSSGTYECDGVYVALNGKYLSKTGGCWANEGKCGMRFEAMDVAPNTYLDRTVGTLVYV